MKRCGSDPYHLLLNKGSYDLGLSASIVGGLRIQSKSKGDVEKFNKRQVETNIQVSFG